jgi:hypothetical protein
MNFNLQILFNDGSTRDVVGKAVDIVAFEERFNMSMASLQNDVRMTHLFFLAWHVEKRTAATTDEFEKWLESVDMVQAGEAKK